LVTAREVVAPPAEAQQHIFISYARDDQSLALRIADDLSVANFSIWIDQIRLRPGDHWDKNIQEALKDSQLMLLLLTDKSAQSDNVADEYHYFLQNKKTIIPVLGGGFNMEDMPYRLSRLQNIDFRSDYDTALARLIEALHYRL